MNYVRIHRSGRVVAQREIELPLSLQQAWGQLRDFRRFACKDFFHREILVDGPMRPGVSIRILHRQLGVSLWRIGRIVKWEENVGFSFSDLSQHGRRVGFPHVFSYRLAAIASEKTKLTIRISGLWTMRVMPRAIARLWLWWSLLHIAQGVENDLLIFTQRRARRRPEGSLDCSHG